MSAKAVGFACPRCTVGRCMPKRVTFCDMLQEQLLSVPNVRAYVCDVCHFVEYDQEWLDALWEQFYNEAPREEYSPVVAPKRSPTVGEG